MKKLLFSAAILFATPAMADMSDTEIRDLVLTVDLEKLGEHYVELLRDDFECSYSINDRPALLDFADKINTIIFDMVDLPEDYRDRQFAQGTASGQDNEAYFILKKAGVVAFEADTKTIYLTDC